VDRPQLTAVALIYAITTLIESFDSEVALHSPSQRERTDEVRRVMTPMKLRLGAIFVATMVLLQACAGSVARSSDPIRNTAPESTTSEETHGNSTEAESHSGGMPRWAWFTIGGILLASAVIGAAVLVARRNAPDDTIFSSDCYPVCEFDNGGS
jgi:hypothetical protein